MLAKVKPLIPARIRRRIFKRQYINELPVELLVEIFLFCLPIGTFPRPLRSEAPLLLGRVCRVWRSISLNTPQLWARINLQDPEWVSGRKKAWNSDPFHRFGLHEWLRRSGNSPLSFEIGEHPRDHISAPLFTITLQAEAHRWKAVSLNTTCNCHEHVFQMLWSPGKTPMLTDLRVPGFGLSAYAQNHTTSQAFPPASQLSSFYLIADNVSLLSRHGNFHALRELCIGYLGVQSSLLVNSFQFIQFPSLETLELTFGVPFYPQDGTMTVVHNTLQHLQTFIFADSGGNSLWLLDMFDTPTLISLAITAHIGEGGRTHLSNFLRRCGGQLQGLKLKGSTIPLNDIHDFIQHTPILKSLCVARTKLTGDWTTLCPPLVRINILIPWRGLEGSMTVVDDIISQRKKSGSKTLASTTTSYTIQIPYLSLPIVLKHQKVKKYIRQGFRISHEEEPWWNKRGY